MELLRADSCDLYASRASYFCCHFSRSRVPEPERHVTEAISSLLPVAECLSGGSKVRHETALKLLTWAQVLTASPPPAAVPRGRPRRQQRLDECTPVRR